VTPFPLGFDPPGARIHTSTPATRSPELLMAVLAEHQFRGFGRYARRDVDGDGHDDTFCNLHTADVAEAMGVVLPRGKRANELALWLASGGAAHGWEKVTEHVARAMADEGQLVVASWFNPHGNPGHICPLEPTLGEPGLWVSNVGGSNFLRGTLAQAFGGRAVDLFAHP
jgi:hypothetical protein